MNKLIAFILALFIFTNTSQAATTISGQIRTNTTWTKAGSPYICSGIVEVDSHSTLTIEPGTIVDLDLGITAYKNVVFQYNTTDTTIIKTHNTSTSSMPCIEMRNYTNADSIVLKRVKFILTGIIVKWPKAITIIEECRFDVSNVRWLPTTMQKFIFKKNKCLRTELHMSTDSVEKVLIDSNAFDSSSITGEINCKKFVEISNSIFKCSAINMHSTGGTIISDNVFYKSATAILFWPVAKPVKIISNVFFENDEAIFLNGVGDTVEIRNNTMYNNNVAISVYYYYKLTSIAPQSNINAPIITGNCIYNNKVAAFAWNAQNSISLGTNWWGTVDTNKIDSIIIDNKDDFKIGLVNYRPYLSTSNPGCKTYTPPANTEKLNVSGNEIKVFPNPFKNTLEFKSGNTIKSVCLYDVVGKIIYQSTTNGNRGSVNTTEYPEGVYLYRIVTQDDKLHTGKVIKE